MTTEIRNWATIASAMEAQGATSSQMYIRAKALANGEADPSPTSYPSSTFHNFRSSITTSLNLFRGACYMAPLELNGPGA